VVREKVEEFLVRQRYDEHDFLEVKVAFVRNIDAGKSTCFSRCKLVCCKHEIESDGRSNNIGSKILGFCDDKILNKQVITQGKTGEAFAKGRRDNEQAIFLILLITRDIGKLLVLK